MRAISAPKLFNSRKKTGPMKTLVFFKPFSVVAEDPVSNLVSRRGFQ